MATKDREDEPQSARGRDDETRSAVSKSSAGDLATKQDLAILEERTRGRFTLLQWLLGCNLALTVAIFWMLILGAH